MTPKNLFFLGLAIIIAKAYASNAPAAPTYPNGKATRMPPPGRLVALVVVFSVAGFLPDRIGVPLDLLILAAIILAPGGIVLPVFEGTAGTGGARVQPTGLAPQSAANNVTVNTPAGPITKNVGPILGF